MKMKALVRSLLLLAVASLLVRGQTQTETRYEDIITAASNQLLPVEEQAFHPLLNQLEVETLNTEDVDQSEVTVRLSFPLQETLCSKAQGQQGQPCPLKKNGKRMMCSMEVRHPILETGNTLNTDRSDISCEYMEAEDAMPVLSTQKIRTRRGKPSGGSRGSKMGSKDSKGGWRGRPGSGSRPGFGSSIAGASGRDQGGTRNA
ncbi:cathelicidin antimicrobial peptide precursor [Salmo salar]|uniref:Cathelicidin antimicrobial peptide n=1 Tax=Salmo salar TaxID=8030 RepID=Q49TU5_SALSA|nr:cathelicidin antimicrobial peptide precursor [Salmo salar]AAR13366.1 cathelicidin antimicrobial peptide [Salmo salar]AAT44537.1 cathelicidin-derived antimicrobial peptide 2 precursor [Salmo salar]|eukprot:NP_001117045.1 cathelicidin antimicrobial peptide precursor [Salmo salar]